MPAREPDELLFQFCTRCGKMVESYKPSEEPVQVKTGSAYRVPPSDEELAEWVTEQPHYVCPSCGTTWRAHAVYIDMLDITGRLCPSCDITLEVGTAFCGMCGQSLDAAARQLLAGLKATEDPQYVPWPEPPPAPPFTFAQYQSMDILKTDRTIYCAVGDFPDETRDKIHSLLLRFDAVLRQGASPNEVEKLFTGTARGLAARAVRLIREFEAKAGEECGAEVVTGDSSPAAGIPAERSLTLQNRNALLFGSEMAELGCATAIALEQLLEALGATKVISGHVD